MKISGHSSMEAFKRYQTILKDDLVKAVDQLSSYLATKKKMATNTATKDISRENSALSKQDKVLLNNQLN